MPAKPAQTNSPIVSGAITRWLPRAAAAALLFTLAGCVTPFTASRDHFGVGLFRVVKRDCGHNVTYREIEGVGLLIADGFATLGYAHHTRVVAPLENQDYIVQTPLATIAVGKSAQSIPLAWLEPSSISDSEQFP